MSSSIINWDLGSESWQSEHISHHLYKINKTDILEEFVPIQPAEKILARLARQLGHLEDFIEVKAP